MMFLQPVLKLFLVFETNGQSFYSALLAGNGSIDYSHPDLSLLGLHVGLFMIVLGLCVSFLCIFYISCILYDMEMTLIEWL